MLRRNVPSNVLLCSIFSTSQFTANVACLVPWILSKGDGDPPWGKQVETQSVDTDFFPYGLFSLGVISQSKWPAK